MYVLSTPGFPPLHIYKHAHTPGSSFCTSLTGRNPNDNDFSITGKAASDGWLSVIRTLKAWKSCLEQVAALSSISFVNVLLVSFYRLFNSSCLYLYLSQWHYSHKDYLVTHSLRTEDLHLLYHPEKQEMPPGQF